MVLDAFLTAVRQPTVPWIVLGAYLVGSIPFGLVLATLFAKTDVRAHGSGNIGATNVARVAGKKLGLVTLLLDAVKGAVPVFLVGALFDDRVAHDDPGFLHVVEAAVGMAAFLGHCFPPWLKFKGGKGVATGLGVLLAHAPEVALVGVVVFALTFAVSRTVSLGSIVGALSLVVAFIVLRPLDATVPPLTVMLVVLLLKHRANMERLFRRQELRL
jgi:glycerol-3-phosphate acyltransferase PlsY